MTSLPPEAYGKRILLVVSGMSPQILTETVHALVRSRQPAWIPTRVRMLTTRAGADHARLNLLQGQAHFLRLCAELGLDPGIFTAADIQVIADGEGRPLADIRSVADNEAAADTITRCIRDATGDADTSLHVSMAGGRKTMGYYAGYALSLYGRAQDRLSHVLVGEGYEGHPDFYYPTAASTPIHRTGKPTLDARDAQVTLAEIPFIRLREDMPDRLLDGSASFAEAIELAQMSRQPQRLVLDFPTMTFQLGGIALDPIGTSNLAFLLWLFDRKLRGLPDLSSSLLGDGAQQRALGAAFADFCVALADADARQGGGVARASRFDRGDDAVRRGLTQADVQYRRSRLNKELKALLGGALAASLELKNTGARGACNYGFTFDEEWIDWTP